MRTRELGFTLVEIVIAVGIMLILLAAGGVWMLSMQPGALRAAVNDVDADFAAAQSIAESSGNGATLVFAPQPGGVSGFTLRVYSGRPNATNAVTPTNVMQVTSATALTEAHFGKPPFTIFLNSAGYATGTGNYPPLDAHENPTFNVIAQQPPCPSGGIHLTFTSPQGATATRTYPCNTLVAGTSVAGPTPSPNPIHVSPTQLVAHWTSDSGPLRFKAAEYGYYHWYASTANGASCQTIASDTGAAPAVFASPWPYAAASPAAQAAASPAPPQLAPYTWPVGDPNDPPGWFQLQPVLHNGGLCTVTVADDYNQSGSVSVQVMGDLAASATSVSLQVGKGSQSIGFSKTFDSEPLTLFAGGPCASIVSVQTQAGTTPPAPESSPATATLTLSPIAKGSCTMIVQDQYGERVAIGINVTAPDQPFATWPASLVVGENGFTAGEETNEAITLAALPPDNDPMRMLNALLGGGVAEAARTYTGPCFAYAFQAGYSAVGSPADTKLPSNVASALGISYTSDGCILNADGSAPYGESSGGAAGTPTGVMAAYEPSGSTGNFQPLQIGCSGLVSTGAWYPSENGVQASLSATGSAPGNCTVDITDNQSTQTPAPDAGQVSVTVRQPCDATLPCQIVLSWTAQTCRFDPGPPPGTVCSSTFEASQVWTTTDDGATWVGSPPSCTVPCSANPRYTYNGPGLNYYTNEVVYGWSYVSSSATSESTSICKAPTSVQQGWLSFAASAEVTQAISINPPQEGTLWGDPEKPGYIEAGGCSP